MSNPADPLEQLKNAINRYPFRISRRHPCQPMSLRELLEHVMKIYYADTWENPLDPPEDCAPVGDDAPVPIKPRPRRGKNG